MTFIQSLTKLDLSFYDFYLIYYKFNKFQPFKQKLEKEKGTWAGFGQRGPRWAAKRPRHTWPSQPGRLPIGAHAAAAHGRLRPRPRGGGYGPSGQAAWLSRSRPAHAGRTALGPGATQGRPSLEELRWGRTFA